MGRKAADSTGGEGQRSTLRPQASKTPDNRRRLLHAFLPSGLRRGLITCLDTYGQIHLGTPVPVPARARGYFCTRRCSFCCQFFSRPFPLPVRPPAIAYTFLFSILCFRGLSRVAAVGSTMAPPTSRSDAVLPRHGRQQRKRHAPLGGSFGPSMGRRRRLEHISRMKLQ